MAGVNIVMGNWKLRMKNQCREDNLCNLQAGESVIKKRAHLGSSKKIIPVL